MGKAAKRRQRATMNEMNEMVQGHVDLYTQQQEEAQAQVDETRADYEAFEFTNPFAGAQNAFGGIQTQFDNIYAGARNVYAGGQNLYEGMENRFEDMTVDMRAADFQVQQGQQQRANIMQGLRGAAGTSGIAGLAQSLANQGSMQSQQIAAGIGQQERQNQMLAAQEGSRIDMAQRGAGMQLQQMQMAGASEQQRMILGGQAQAQQLGVSQANVQAQGQWAADMAQMEGAAAVQAAEFGQQATLLGMDYGMLAGANSAQQQAFANQMSAMGMTADMHGSQAANNPFSQILSAGATVAAGWASGGFAKCFLVGTLVLMSDDSWKAIEDIQIGDSVRTKDGNNTPVQDSFIHNINKPIRMYTNGKLQVTGTHPLYIDEKWQTADELNWESEVMYVDNLYYLQTEDSYIVEGIPAKGPIPTGAPGISISELTVEFKQI